MSKENLDIDVCHDLKLSINTSSDRSACIIEDQYGVNVGSVGQILRTQHENQGIARRIVSCWNVMRGRNPDKINDLLDAASRVRDNATHGVSSIEPEHDDLQALFDALDAFEERS